jgi:hypothetical protein
MTNTAKRLLADIRELAPDISSRAAEIEAGRRIPPDLVEALRSICVFRMFVPSEPRRAGARSADGAGDHRSARQNRRFGWLDRDDRQQERHLCDLAGEAVRSDASGLKPLGQCRRQ